MALVTSHFTLDKVNAELREHLAAKADFVGAIRLPSDAFRNEGTKVVTDIVFLKKRLPGEPPKHADPEWLSTEAITVEDADIPINQYFLRHPEMVLGTWSRKNRLYSDGYSLDSSGDLAQQLREAVARLPQNVASVSANVTSRRRRRLSSLPRRSITSPRAASSSATTASSTRSRTARRNPSPTVARCFDPTAR